ncbi:MAG: nicotinate (nicotinamide) nucleotide adenylyltransferase [Verrucomicrobiota bacterium]
MERIGIYGGSFNPVTCGHLLVARAALEEAQLDRLHFVPAAQSPFKPDQLLASGDARCRWLRLALAGWERCELDDQELKRGGVSYTVDTLRDYARRFPDATLCYLIGADHLCKLPQWRDAGTLANLAEFLVIPRPGEVAAALPPPFRGRLLKGFPLGVSASEVRARLKAGLPIAGLVPETAVEIIEKSGLYL